MTWCTCIRTSDADDDDDLPEEERSSRLSVCVTRMDRRAVIPTYPSPYAVGFDLTIIKIVRHVTNLTTLYTTGLRIYPPPGYFIEIIPRSHYMINSGYIMTNSIGMIDEDHRGNIHIALTKIDYMMPDIQLPARVAQCILRKAEYADIHDPPLIHSSHDTR